MNWSALRTDHTRHKVFRFWNCELTLTYFYYRQFQEGSQEEKIIFFGLVVYCLFNPVGISKGFLDYFRFCNLPRTASGMQNNYNLARGEIQDTLKGNYDPRDSDYWRGFRQEANRLKEEAQTDVRQRSQLGGMLKSSPSAGIEAESNQRYDSAILQELGKLQENERQRRLNAAGMAGQVDSQHLSNVSGANQIADQQRQIEQARNDELYRTAMYEVLAPYKHQYKLALSLLNEQRYTGVQTGGGLTDLGFYMNTMSGMTSSMASSMGGGAI